MGCFEPNQSKGELIGENVDKKFRRMNFLENIISVSIIGPDRSPIYIVKSEEEQHSLEVEAMIYEAIAILEKIPVRPAQRSSDRFVPKFHKNTKMVTWAYRAGLKYTIIVMTPNDMQFDDKKVLAFLEKIRNAVFDSFSDPFYSPFSSITSTAFNNCVIENAKKLTAFASGIQQ